MTTDVPRSCRIAACFPTRTERNVEYAISETPRLDMSFTDDGPTSTRTAVPVGIAVLMARLTDTRGEDDRCGGIGEMKRGTAAQMQLDLDDDDN